MSSTRFPHQRDPSFRTRIGLLIAALWLAGCSTIPPEPPPAPAVQPLDQYMQEASSARASGSNDRARELYRTAARSYPTSKEPWLELAEDYFEAANYGQAILASQEVLQRDPNDKLATSVLAVSGLRLSASALAMLRQNTLPPDARSEAEGLARTLREVLGEPVLVPRPAVEIELPPAPKPPSKRKAAPRRAAPPATSPATAPKKAATTGNPFNLLKQ